MVAAYLRLRMYNIVCYLVSDSSKCKMPNIKLTSLSVIFNITDRLVFTDHTNEKLSPPSTKTITTIATITTITTISTITALTFRLNFRTKRKSDGSQSLQSPHILLSLRLNFCKIIIDNFFVPVAS